MPTYVKNRSFTRVQRVFTEGPDTDSASVIGIPQLVWNDNFNGQKNPGWREQVKQHSNAGTPASGSRFRIMGHTSGGCTFVLKRKSASADYDKVVRRVLGDLLDSTDLPVLSPYVNIPVKDQAINLALALFYSKAWNAIRSFQGGTFLGELRESLSMIRSPAKAIRKGLNFYVSDARRRTRSFRRTGRRIDPARVTDAHKIIGDTWLEYAFGWAPLISDIQSGAEALARLAIKPYDYKTFAAKIVKEEELALSASLYTYSKVLDGNIRYWIQNRKNIGQIIVRYLAEVKCEVENPYLMSQEVLGFSWNDFAPTVWELIPYSFLVDYFTNIGDVISAWSFPRNRISWHNRTIKHSAQRTVLAIKRPTPNPNTAWYTIESDTGPNLKVQLSRSSFTRDQDFIGFPTVTLEIPGASLKWLNIAALGQMRLL